VAFFASETMSGKQPFWPDNLMKRHIRPVAKAIGHSQTKRWHTFRHTFGTLLKANGEDVKTVQELYGTPAAGSRWRFINRVSAKRSQRPKTESWGCFLPQRKRRGRIEPFSTLGDLSKPTI
jgi:integrase